MNQRLNQQKLRSMAKKCLSLLEELEDTLDLSFVYNSDLEDFFKNNADLFGIEDPKEEIVKNKPPKRKVGTRPPPPKHKRKNPITPISQPNETEKSALAPTKSKTSLAGWQRKLYKKIMMETHPDRVGTIAKSARDEIKRLEYNNLVMQTEEDAVLLSVGTLLNLDPEIDYKKQFQILKVFELTTSKKISDSKKTFGFLWGEHNENSVAKAKIIQELIKINGLPEKSIEEIVLLFAK